MKRIYAAIISISGINRISSMQRFDIAKSTLEDCIFAYAQIQENSGKGWVTTTQVQLPEGSAFTFEEGAWKLGAHSDLGEGYIVEVTRDGANIGTNGPEGFMDYYDSVGDLLKVNDTHFGDNFLRTAPGLDLDNLILPEDRDKFRVALEGYMAREADREARLASRRERI